MNAQLHALMELSTDPSIVVEEKTICYVNTAAQAAFPGLAAGLPMRTVFPEHLTDVPAGEVSGMMMVFGQVCHVRGADAMGLRFYTFLPEETKASSLFSQGALGRISTELTVERQCVETLFHRFPATKGDLEPYASMYLHSYFKLRRQVEHMMQMILLQGKEMPFSLQKVDLVQLCHQILDSADQMRSAGRPTVRFLSELDRLDCEADQELLTRMLLNLLSNAMEKCGPDNEVCVRLHRSGNEAIFRIEDNGPGISSGELPHVFNRYQLPVDDTHLERAATAGFGLSIAEGIARLHGGTLMVESGRSRTQVSVSLPLQHNGAPLQLRGGTSLVRIDGRELFLTELSEVLDRSCFSPDELG